MNKWVWIDEKQIDEGIHTASAKTRPWFCMILWTISEALSHGSASRNLHCDLIAVAQGCRKCEQEITINLQERMHFGPLCGCTVLVEDFILGRRPSPKNVPRFNLQVENPQSCLFWPWFSWSSSCGRRVWSKVSGAFGACQHGGLDKGILNRSCGIYSHMRHSYTGSLLESTSLQVEHACKFQGGWGKHLQNHEDFWR